MVLFIYSVCKHFSCDHETALKASLLAFVIHFPEADPIIPRENWRRDDLEILEKGFRNQTQRYFIMFVIAVRS